MGHWIVKNKKIVEVDLMTWAKWFQENHHSPDRIVKQETLANGYEISTVFLGIDHNFMDTGDPLLFETMVFKPKRKKITLGKRTRMVREDADMNRYHTWQEAEKGHQEMVKRWELVK